MIGLGELNANILAKVIIVQFRLATLPLARTWTANRAARVTGAETVTTHFSLDPLVVAFVLASSSATGFVAVFAWFVTLGHARLLLVTPHGLALFLISWWRWTVVGAVVTTRAAIVVAWACLEAVDGNLVAFSITFFFIAYCETL